MLGLGNKCYKCAITNMQDLEVDLPSIYWSSVWHDAFLGRKHGDIIRSLPSICLHRNADIWSKHRVTLHKNKAQNCCWGRGRSEGRERESEWGIRATNDDRSAMRFSIGSTIARINNEAEMMIFLPFVTRSRRHSSHILYTSFQRNPIEKKKNLNFIRSLYNWKHDPILKGIRSSSSHCFFLRQQTDKEVNINVTLDC